MFAVTVAESTGSTEGLGQAALIVIGAVIALLGTIVVQLLAGHQESRLDSTRRQDDRRIERERFERESVVALQEAALALYRALPAVRSDGDEVDHEAVEEAIAIMRLHDARIADGGARRASRALIGAAVDYIGAAPRQADFVPVKDAFNSLSDCCGAVIRDTLRHQPRNPTSQSGSG